MAHTLNKKYIADFCPACGSPTEQSHEHGMMRPKCTSCGHVIFFDPKVAVIAFIAQDDKILLIQRDVEPGKGFWALVGGFVEIDEHPEETVERETLEETGLEVQVGHVLDVYHLPDYHTVTIAYTASITGGKINAGDDAADVAWFSKDSLPELFFESTKTLVKLWQNDQI